MIYLAISFNKTTVWTATTPAVSVRSLLCPINTGSNPYFNDSFNSAGLKSPSGPINTTTSEPGLYDEDKSVLSESDIQ